MHIGVFVGDAIENILSGKKKIEGRFSIARLAPYAKVKKGDIILLKPSGGKIFGQVEADNVLYFENLDGEKLGKLRREYGEDLAMPDEFWQSKAKARYATIIFLKNPRRYLSTLSCAKRDRRGWMIRA